MRLPFKVYSLYTAVIYGIIVLILLCLKKSSLRNKLLLVFVVLLVSELLVGLGLIPSGGAGLFG